MSFSQEVEESIKAGEVPVGFEDYAEVSQVVKVPKAAVKDALKNTIIDGAEVVTKISMQIK